MSCDPGKGSVRAEDILATEYSDEFDAKRKNAMCVSRFKYGLLTDAYPHRVDAVASLKRLLELYEFGDVSRGIKPGTTEYLVDVANFAMIEFMLPRHPEAHYQATDSSGSPGRATAVGGHFTQGENTSLAREFKKDDYCPGCPHPKHLRHAPGRCVGVTVVSGEIIPCTCIHGEV
jgi:hypothetical protein